jgi:hypothetical protein
MKIVSSAPSSLTILTVLLAPIRAVAARLVSEKSCAKLIANPAHSQQVAKQLTLPFEPEVDTAKWRAASNCVVTKTRRHAMRPATGRLKVVREVDAAVSPACAGRMVISGRMADVCAELERMVQQERMHQSVTHFES